MKAPQRTKVGFTLLELLVSIAILAMLAVMITGVFSTSSDAITRGRAEAALDEAARFILDAIEVDLSQALIRTNVPFRVDTVSIGDALYCVSPGVRRMEETNPRDCAPIRFRSSKRIKLVSALNRRAVFEYAAGATGSNAEALLDLIAQSNYRNVERVPTQGSVEFTEPIESMSGTAQYAFLTFLDFRINGLEATPAETSPRFVDIVLGLASARDTRHAMRLYESGASTAALAYLAERERVYTRRIYMPNRAFTGIAFE